MMEHRGPQRLHHAGYTHEYHVPPVSRTTQYKKVTKPLLERKRRARINRCLDELKDLMVGALEAEGENVSKLEKADILELTVRHLHSLGRPRDAVEDAHRFQAGFSQCASEACQFLLSLPGLDARVGRRLVSHLGQCVSGPLSVQVAPPSRSCYSPPVSPASASYTPHSLPRRAAPSSNDVHGNAVLTSTPSVDDLSRPLTGLLMTVPSPSSSSSTSSRCNPPEESEIRIEQQKSRSQPKCDVRKGAPRPGYDSQRGLSASQRALHFDPPKDVQKVRHETYRDGRFEGHRSGRQDAHRDRHDFRRDVRCDVVNDVPEDLSMWRPW